MSNSFKPAGYNSVSPYFIVDDAERFLDFLAKVLDGQLLRRYDRPDGTIMHAEVKIDDSVIMLGNASDRFPPIRLVLHVYYPDVDGVYDKAIAYGCAPVESPKEQDNDPDRRGTFEDMWGNMWSIGRQL